MDGSTRDTPPSGQEDGTQTLHGFPERLRTTEDPNSVTIRQKIPNLCVRELTVEDMIPELGRDPEIRETQFRPMLGQEIHHLRTRLR